MDADKKSYSNLEPVAAFVMLVGPGSAVAFYSALVGFYAENFSSRIFFVFMMACLYVPAPIISLLQERFDAFFDRRFSTNITFFFRVVVMQIALVFLVFAWIFIPQTPSVVLIIGFMIGVIYGSVASSSIQMVAAMEPAYIVYAQIGQQLGAVSPIGVFLLFDFHPSASLQEFRIVVFAIILLSLSASFTLCYFHFTLGMFDKTYERLACDHDFRRAVSETVLLVPTDSGGGVPAWVWRWVACCGGMTGVEACLMSSVGFFGNVELAQFLTVAKLSMDFSGRIIALPICKVPGFAAGPWHKVLGASVFVFSAMCLIIFAELLGVGVWKPMFLVAWFIVHCVYNFTCSLVDVTAGSYVEVKDRKMVARRLFMVTVTCGLAGIVAAVAIVLFGGRFPVEWPNQKHAIS